MNVMTITKFSDFLKSDFTPKYRDFINEIGGIYPLYFSVEAMTLTLPLYSLKGETPFFVVVFYDHKIVGFLPMQVETVGHYPLVYRTLRLWGKAGRYNDCQHADFMALPEYQEQAANVAMQFLAKEYTEQYDQIIFNRIVTDTLFFNRIDKNFAGGKSFGRDDPVHLYCANIPLDERIKGETRRKIRKANEKLLAGPEAFTFHCYSSLEDKLIEDICHLHIERQHALIKVGQERMCFLEDDLEKRVFFQHLQYAQSLKALRIYALRLNQNLVCFLINVSLGGYTDALLTAFAENPEHKHMARCLWYYAFDSELNHFSVDVINMGYGTHILKRTFSTQLVQLFSLSFRNTTRLGARVKNGLRNWMKK